MGYWSTDTEGHSFATNPGVKLLWGDSPADELDAALNDLYAHLGRVPEASELLDLFDRVSVGVVESPAAVILQDGLGDAIAMFSSDLGRKPSEAELRAGFLFSLGSLDYDKEQFLSNLASPVL